MPPALPMACATLQAMDSLSKLPQASHLKEALLLNVSYNAALSSAGVTKEDETAKALNDMQARLYQMLERDGALVLCAALQNPQLDTKQIEELFDTFAIVPPGTGLADMAKASKSWLTCGKEFTWDLELSSLSTLLPCVQQYCTLNSFKGCFAHFAPELGERIKTYINVFDEAAFSLFSEGSALHKESLEAKEKIQKFRRVCPY